MYVEAGESGEERLVLVTWCWSPAHLVLSITAPELRTLEPGSSDLSSAHLSSSPGSQQLHQPAHQPLHQHLQHLQHLHDLQVMHW